MISVVNERNEVIGFPDTTDKNTIEQVLRGDLYGEISTPKPNFYKDKIQPVLEKTGMSMFQPNFNMAEGEISDLRAFASTYARDVSYGMFDTTESKGARKSIEEHPVAAWIGSFVGQTQAIVQTGGALKAVGMMKDAANLTKVGGAVWSGAKLGAVYGAITSSTREVKKSLKENVPPDVLAIGYGAIKDAGIFALYGGVGGAIESRMVGSAAIAGTAYGISKMEGASEEDALLNAGVMGITHFAMTEKPTKKEYRALVDDLDRMKAAYLKSMNPVMSDPIAIRAAQEHTLKIIDELRQKKIDERIQEEMENEGGPPLPEKSLEPTELEIIKAVAEDILDVRLQDQMTSEGGTGISVNVPGKKKMKDVIQAVVEVSKGGTGIKVEKVVPEAVKPAENITTITQEAPKPVQEGKGLSRVFERAKERYSEILKDTADLEYDKIQIADQMGRAFDLIEKDPVRGRKVAMGLMNAPDGVTETAVNIAYTEKMLETGNHAEYAKAISSSSLRQTERGQEIVMEKARATNVNDPASFVKQLMDAKMNQAGKKLWSFKERMTGTAKKALVEKIKAESKDLKAEMDKKMLSIDEAQKIIDELRCK